LSGRRPLDHRGEPVGGTRIKSPALTQRDGCLEPGFEREVDFVDSTTAKDSFLIPILLVLLHVFPPLKSSRI
jgi:hypothetical protein